MRAWRLRGRLRIDETPDGLDAAYRREVGWDQGLRINSDARLLLLGFGRLLGRGLLSEVEKRQAAIVLGCQLGSMESYEAFDSGLARGQPAPLAFSNALPSIPLASACLRHGLRGPVYTLTGGREVGLRSLRVGARLLASGRARHAVIGCWEAASQTARRCGLPARPRLLLAVLESVQAA